MQLLVFRSLWGMTGSLSEQLERIAAAGYDGVEAWTFRLHELDLPPDALQQLLDQHNLKLIIMTYANANAEIETVLTEAAAYQPLKIGFHGGRDYLPFGAGCAFFEEALRVEAEIGIPVAHETHRGRLLFTPWTTASYLRQFDDLKILADYSHWVNVCERLPDDQTEALSLAHDRANHIHGRVGYEQGPQVPDPSAPEFQTQLEWHEAQWRQIQAVQQKSSTEYLTFTPEYGPPAYLHTLPHTNVPVADLWDVCLWSMERARQLFG